MVLGRYWGFIASRIYAVKLPFRRTVGRRCCALRFSVVAVAIGGGLLPVIVIPRAVGRTTAVDSSEASSAVVSTMAVLLRGRLLHGLVSGEGDILLGNYFE